MGHGGKLGQTVEMAGGVSARPLLQRNSERKARSHKAVSRYRRGASRAGSATLGCSWNRRAQAGAQSISELTYASLESSGRRRRLTAPPAPRLSLAFSGGRQSASQLLVGRFAWRANFSRLRGTIPTETKPEKLPRRRGAPRMHRDHFRACGRAREHCHSWRTERLR